MDNINDLTNVFKHLQIKENYKDLGIASVQDYEFLQTLIETIPNAIFFKDSEFIYRHCNTAFLEYLGLDRDSVIGHSVYDISKKELADVYNKADIELFNGVGKQTYEAKVKYADGLYHDVIFNKAVVFSKGEYPIGIVGVIIDITERRRDEKKIQQLLRIKEAMLEVNHLIMEVHNSSKLFKLILDKVMMAMNNAYVGIALVLDKNDNLIGVAWEGIYGEERKVSFHLKESFLWNSTKGKMNMTTIINDVDSFAGRNVAEILKSTLGFVVHSAISSPIMVEEKLYGIITMYSKHNNVFDKSDLEIMEYMRKQVELSITTHKMFEKNMYLSRNDKLTDLYNRGYFDELFLKNLKESNENKKEFLLVILDLNKLKFVNDTYGHLAGDRYISRFANHIKGVMGTNDIVSRLGGDEFSIVCFNKNLQQLINILEDLQRYFKINALHYRDNKIICSFSYGIARFPQDGKDYNTLMRLADERMYKYKQRFRDGEYKNKNNF